MAGAPHLAPGDFGDILRRLRVVITKDSNVVCVAEAVACVGALAKVACPGDTPSTVQHDLGTGC